MEARSSSKRKRWILVAIAVAVVVLLIAVALPFLIGVNTFRPMLESRASQVVGRTVKLGTLKLSVFSGSFSQTTWRLATIRPSANLLFLLPSLWKSASIWCR